MKKNLLIIIAALLTLNVWGQTNTFPSSGNVGIGTISPIELLHVEENDHAFILVETTSNQKFAGIKLTGKHVNNKATSKIYMDYYGGTAGNHGLNYISGREGFANHWFKDNLGNVQMGILDNGNIGIGTRSPSKKLDVAGDINFTGNLYKNGTLVDLAGGSSEWKQNNSDIYYNDGNVSIGTSTIPEGYKLAVNGKIMATELKVETGWADFVFDKDYELMTIKEFDTFIKQNKHLPNIPTAKEVEENGISVGEMNAKLLEKIEILSLYIIQLENRIENLENK